MRCFKPVWLCQPCWLLWLLLVLVARQPWILAAEDQDKAPAAVVEAPKDVADLRTIETRIQEVVAKVLPCTLGIRIGRGQGSGVIVSRDGYVITAGHVVGKPGQDVTLFCADGKTVQGKTLGVYKNADELKPGTWCLATGHPLGYQNDRPPVVRLGRVLRSTDIVIQTDCPLIAGDSGGPLFDLEGKVLGINSRIGGNTKMNFHVPVDVYQDHWDRLVAGETAPRSRPPFGKWSPRHTSAWSA
jgi:serine protease Do